MEALSQLQQQPSTRPRHYRFEGEPEQQEQDDRSCIVEQEPHALFLPPEVLLNHVVAFLRPRDAAQLMSTSKALRALDPHAHVRCIRGKFRSSSLLLANLHRCRRLATIDLKGNRLTSEGIRTLGEFLAGAAPSASSLETLDLSALSLTSLGIRLLAQSLAGGGGGHHGSSHTHTHRRRRLPLKALALAVNNAGDEGAAAIGDLFGAGVLPQLEEANVSNSVITFKGLAHLARGLEGCPRLRRINLSNNPLFEIPGALFPFGVLAASEAALAAWDAFACALPSTLESLSIFNALLSAVAIHRLVLHWRVPALRSCNLSWNRIGPDGCVALAQSIAKGACPSLQALNLSHCVVSKAALADLTQALSAPRGIKDTIQHLNLGWNPLNAAEDGVDAAPSHEPNPCARLRALASALARCPNLTTLTLSNVELGDEGAVALVQGFLDAAAADPAGVCLPKLTQLVVSWNGISPTGMKAVAGLFTASSSSSSSGLTPITCAPNLQALDISYNAAGTEGLRAMAAAWGASPSPSPSAPSARLPPGLIVHVIGNQVPRCTHHQVPAAQLGKLLDEIDQAAAAAAAVAAMAAFASRHAEGQAQAQEQEQQTEEMKGVVACSSFSSSSAAASSPAVGAVTGAGEVTMAMDQGTQTPQPQQQQSQQPQQQQQQQQQQLAVAGGLPILPLMAPLPTTPEHPRPQRRTTGRRGGNSSSTTATHTAAATLPSTGGAVAAAAAAGDLRRSARVRRTATATLTAPYIPPSSSEGYYLTTRNRRRRLCTHGNSGRR